MFHLAAGVKIDVRQLVRQLDLEIQGLRGSPLVEASLGNTAEVKRSGTAYSLFMFLDRGTRPHWILPKLGGYLANEVKDFGPVKGGVLHPGIIPHDLSARALVFFEQEFGRIQMWWSVEKITTGNESIFVSTIRKSIAQALISTRNFVMSITPWPFVRESYVIRINGRKVEEL